MSHDLLSSLTESSKEIVSCCHVWWHSRNVMSECGIFLRSENECSCQVTQCDTVCIDLSESSDIHCVFCMMPCGCVMTSCDKLHCPTVTAGTDATIGFMTRWLDAQQWRKVSSVSVEKRVCGTREQPVYVLHVVSLTQAAHFPGLSTQAEPSDTGSSLQSFNQVVHQGDPGDDSAQILLQSCVSRHWEKQWNNQRCKGLQVCVIVVYIWPKDKQYIVLPW